MGHRLSTGSRMRQCAVLLLLWAVPATAQTFVGKVVRLEPGPAVRLSQAGIDPINPSTAYLAWDFSPTETADDATLPCCTRIPLTPTPAIAAAMTYRLRSVAAPNVFNGTRILSGVTCDLTGCRTPPLMTFMPEAAQGGSWSIVLTRELLPRFHESTSSEPLAFTTFNGGGPPPPPPLATCPFTPLNQTVQQQLPLGTVLHAVGTLTPGQAGRWLQLALWHWKLTILPLLNNRFDITAVCLEPA